MTTTVHEDSGRLLSYVADLAEAWKGWGGEKEYASLEGQLSISAIHDGLGTVTLRVRLRQQWPPEWSAEATLELGPGPIWKGKPGP